MNRLLVLAIVAFMACNNPVKAPETVDHAAHAQHDASAGMELNNGQKWKADLATKTNVAAMVEVVNDNRYTDEQNREQLASTMQTKLDTLVKQCRMKGPDHDALHVWLEKVLVDMKALKDPGSDYNQSFAALKNDVLSFENYFE